MPTKQIVFIAHKPKLDDVGGVYGGRKAQFLGNCMRRAGIMESSYEVLFMTDPLCKQRLEMLNPNVIVPMGESPLSFTTGLTHIYNWHLSIIPTKAEWGRRKVIPLLDPAEVIKSYQDSAYISFGAMKIADEMNSPEINIPERRFHLGFNGHLSVTQVIEYLNDVVAKADTIAVDIETSKGIINTVGFAVSPSEAIAICTDIYTYANTPEINFDLWTNISKIISSPSKKIIHNMLYECQYFSRYGIWLGGLHHDTMWGQKFLHPELEMGLDNAARIYTKFPYWKKSGSDWTRVDNWVDHLSYNSKDTTSTYSVYMAQREDMRERKLESFFDDFLMEFSPCVREMCTRGLLVNMFAKNELSDKLNRQIETYMKRLHEVTEQHIGYKINPRSPKQVKEILGKLNIKLPSRRDKKTGEMKISSDKKALLTLRKKHKDNEVLDLLIKLSKDNKQLSSYADFNVDPDGHVRYSIGACATETGRWNSTLDPWGNGFNAQTVPKSVRYLFIAEPDKHLVQIDLDQAESRYVARDSPEPKLIDLIDRKEDIHTFVAGQIFRKDPKTISKSSPERQLGKKAGHAANYGVGPRTFSESCLVENDLVVPENEAARLIKSYFELFPGIRLRQERIKTQIMNTKFMRTPLGRERYFYGRLCDATFREAYAYCPQSTIPDITNHLMLFLKDHCELLLQVHDSLLLQATSAAHVKEIIDMAYSYDLWHPEITLIGGDLRIPVGIEVGQDWKNMDKV